MLLRDQLVSDCTDIILDAVRSKHGRLRFVSDESKVNRRCFTNVTFRNMRWFRLVRILYCLSMVMGRQDFCLLGSRLFEAIWESADYYDYILLDEKKRT